MSSIDWSLYCDLYQLTMSQAYFDSNKLSQQATFSMYFREYPFDGGYAVMCGTSELVDILNNYKFSKSDIDYLSSIKAPDGTLLFKKGFLELLCNMSLEIDILAAPEGSIVFPNEPILRVSGSAYQCQLLETLILNCVSFQSLIATKAARVCLAARGRPVTEFGLRRAQGIGGIWASRAAYVGGCVSTSNVCAAKAFNIPVAGTHGHSWVMSFDSELDAFRSFADAFPGNCSLLVDTYDVESGVKNAITVAREMRGRGQNLNAIRIDSGDLSWLAKQARKMLDDSGFQDVKIMLTNDLDEYTITSILDEGAPVDIFGVGTKLSTAYNQPTLGGVYKLSAIRESESCSWEPKIKISESVSKTSIPGVLNVYRYYSDDGKIAGDMVFDENTPINESHTIVDPVDLLRQKKLKGLKSKLLLEPLISHGKPVKGSCKTAKESRDLCLKSLNELDETQLRIMNPHTYPVGFEKNLYDLRNELVSKSRSTN